MIESERVMEAQKVEMEAAKKFDEAANMDDKKSAASGES